MASSFRCDDVRDLSGGQALVMSGRWQKRETIPEVFAPPWLFELPKPLFQSEAECEAIDMEMIFYFSFSQERFCNKARFESENFWNSEIA